MPLRSRIAALPSWTWPAAALVVYKAALDVTYPLVIPGSHYYALFVPTWPAWHLVESYLLLVPILAAFPYRRDRVSTVFLWLGMLISYVPMLTIYAVRDESRPFMYATAAFWVLVALVVRLLPDVRLPVLRRDVARYSYIGIYAALVVVSSIVLALNFATVIDDLASVGVNLAGAYGARHLFVNAHLPLNGYYFHWLAMIFNPIFFVLALERRKWLPALLVLALEILIAGFVGMRQYYVVLPFVAIIAFLASRRSPLAALGLGFAAIVAVSYLTFEATGLYEGYLFFVGRFLLDAAQLTFLYRDFFDAHGPIPLAYAFQFYFRIPYPWAYTLPTTPDLAVARTFFNQSIAAVGGIVADAYMNLGYAGMAIWAVWLGVTMRIADYAGRHVGRAVAAAAITMPTLALSDTYFIRVFFTTGLLWAFLFLYLYGQSRHGRPRAEKRVAVNAAAGALAGRSG